MSTGFFLILSFSAEEHFVVARYKGYSYSAYTFFQVTRRRTEISFNLSVAQNNGLIFYAKVRADGSFRPLSKTYF